MNITATIPSYRKIHDERSYTVFCIEVRTSSLQYRVERRYTEFEKLNKKLKKIHVTPPFPPKSVRKWNRRILEARRQALEAYLQGVLSGECHSRHLYVFLGLSTAPGTPLDVSAALSSSESLDVLGDGSSLSDGLSHQSVIAFHADTFQTDTTTRGGLLDIITTGVTQGLYGSVDDVR